MSVKKTRTLSLCLCAVFATLTFVLTFINIRLPIPGNGGLVHLGNIPVIVAAVLLGKKYSAAAGALGMTLFDILGGWFAWAPYTFVIRLLVGFIIGWLAERKAGQSFGWNLLGVILGGVVLVSGYYAAEWMIYGNPLAPTASILGNALQVVTMAVFGLPLAMAVQKALTKTRLFS